MTRFLLTLESAAKLIEWSYSSPHSHGKIAIPKVQSFKITDIARALVKHYTGDANNIELKIVGIRKGEKLHEEMISAEEWMRTEEHEHYLISDEIIHNTCISYNSYDSVMPEDQVYDFLKSTGVI
jgi:UDP-N-acetylglucosamine 4,6-dehydratase